MAPEGRFRQVIDTFVADEVSVTGYVAVELAVTVTVVAVNVGAMEELVEESTSNCMAPEEPCSGAGVCTVIAVVPAEAISDAVICAVSCVALPYCVVRAVDPQ